MQQIVFQPINENPVWNTFSYNRHTVNLHFHQHKLVVLYAASIRPNWCICPMPSESNNFSYHISSYSPNPITLYCKLCSEHKKTTVYNHWLWYSWAFRNFRQWHIRIQTFLQRFKHTVCTLYLLVFMLFFQICTQAVLTKL